MRVAHFLAQIDLTQGGVVRAVLDLVGALADRGHIVELLTHDPKDAPQEWRSRTNLTVTTLPGPSRPLGLLNASERSAVRERLARAEVLHLHTPWETANTQFGAIARSLGKPYVLSVHGMLDDWSMSQRSLKKRVYLTLAGRRLLRGASAVHCTAKGELDQASRWFAGARGVVVPLLIDLAPFETLPGSELAAQAYKDVSPSAGRVLFLSRLHVKKGVESLLDAVANLVSDGLDVVALIAGAGDEAYVQSLRDRAARLGLAERARFVGHVGGAIKVSLYEWADVFVLPTSQENFGLVLPESLACRTPVVTTKGVDIWPELEASGGAVITESSPDRLSKVIRDLLGDPDRRRDMGEKGRRWVFERLAPAVVIGQYEALYKDAIEREAARRRPVAMRS